MIFLKQLSCRKLLQKNVSLSNLKSIREEKERGELGKKGNNITLGERGPLSNSTTR